MLVMMLCQRSIHLPSLLPLSQSLMFVSVVFTFSEVSQRAFMPLLKQTYGVSSFHYLRSNCFLQQHPFITTLIFHRFLFEIPTTPQWTPLRSRHSLPPKLALLELLLMAGDSRHRILFRRVGKVLL